MLRENRPSDAVAEGWRPALVAAQVRAAVQSAVISVAACRRAVVWISSTQAFISGLLLVAVFHVSSSSSMSPRVGRRVGSSISSVRQRRQPARVYVWSLAFGFCGVFGVVRVALQCGQRRGGQLRPVRQFFVSL